MSGPARYTATAVFMLIVVASGVTQGVFTHRWVPPPSLDGYVARLRDVPEIFDEWESEVNAKSEDLGKNGLTAVKNETTGKLEYRFLDDLKLHGIQDYIFRVYKNKRSMDNYQVLIVCGRPGPIASHTPDVCYRNSGFEQIGEESRSTIDVAGKSYPLFKLNFQPPSNRSDVAYEKEIRWACMPPSKGLIASSAPRIEFAREPALYKIYIIHDEIKKSPNRTIAANNSFAPEEVTSEQKTQAFLEKFLPRLETALRDTGSAP